MDGGFIIPLEAKDKLNDKIMTGDEMVLNLQEQIVTNNRTGESYSLRPLGDVLPIIDAGGLFSYARKSGMIG